MFWQIKTEKTQYNTLLNVKLIRYLVGSMQRADQHWHLLHHPQVMLQLLQLLVEPGRTQEDFT